MSMLQCPNKSHVIVDRWIHMNDIHQYLDDLIIAPVRSSNDETIDISIWEDPAIVK